MEVGEIMTRAPETVRGDCSIKDALALMLECDIRHLPVVEDGKLIGIVSDRDIRDYSLPVSDEFFELSSHRARLDKEVRAVMTTGVFTVTIETDVKDVVEYMVAEKFTAIPIVSGHDDKLEGIVSYIDILKACSAYL